MLTHPTIDQLRALRLDGMAEAFVELQSQDAARDLAPAEWLALLGNQSADQSIGRQLQEATLSGHPLGEDLARRLEAELGKPLRHGKSGRPSKHA